MTRPKKPADPPPSDTARAPVAPPVTLRVREIRRRLERGVWTSDQAAELAAAWGITEAMVRGHAAEAQRQLEAILDAGQVAREVLAESRAAIDEAFAQGDMKAVKGLLEVQMKLAGIDMHKDSKSDPRHLKAAPQPEGGNVVHLPPWKKKPA